MIYQQTPDFYNEYISHSAVWEGRSRYRNDEDELEHGWAKDAAAKAHKYIDRWRGKNGKWYYRYKSKAQELGAKVDRKIKGIKVDEISDNTYNDYTTGKRRIIGKTSRYVLGKDSGKAGSRSVGLSSNRPGFKGNITRVDSSVSRKPKKNGNLTSRGYSGSKGSGESQRQRNLGTRHSSRSLINTTKDVVKIGNTTYTIDKAARAKGYNEYRKNPQRFMAKDAIKNGRELAKSDKYSANKGYKRGKKKKR